MPDRMKAFYDNARKMTFEHNGVKITVREGLVVDQLDSPVYRRFLRDKRLAEATAQPAVLSDIEWNRIWNCVEFIMRTVAIAGKMPNDFRLPNYDDPDSWYDAYWKFIQLPLALFEAWNTALDTVNKPEPDPEAVPGGGKSTKST